MERSTFFDVFKSAKDFQFPVGQSKNGGIIFSDLKRINHLFICGATGTGKSNFLHGMLLTLLGNNPPNVLRSLMFDSKILELSLYNGIGNLLVPVITDVSKLYSALQWIEVEIFHRLKLLSDAGKRTLADYNSSQEAHGVESLPYLLVVIDDFASVASSKQEILKPIQEILSRGRSVGVFLVVSTQLPTYTGIKKITAQFRSKVVFSSLTASESRFLIGNPGAKTLSGCGDAIYVSNTLEITKIKTYYVAQDDIEAVLSPLKSDDKVNYNSLLADLLNVSDATASASSTEGNMPNDKYVDKLFLDAVDVVFETNQASVSMLQRRLKLGYSTAFRLVDLMEAKGIVGPFEGRNPRQLLISREQWEKMRKAELYF